MSENTPPPNPLIENNYFYLSSDGTYYIVGIEGLGCAGVPFEINGHLDIPAEYNNKPVKAIGENAFYNCTSLTSITIPDSVTSIGSSAFFDCTALTSITIPDSVTSIGERAFYNCTSLTSITIGNNVTSIGNDAFYNCRALTSITIPDSVTSIGNWAFQNCSALKNVIIKGKPTVNSSAFNSTAKLEKIYVIDGKGYSPTDTIDGKPIEILPADGAVIAKTMNVKLMTIS